MLAHSITQPPATHYSHGYDNKPRLASYWHQADECGKLKAESVLMIGAGSGLAVTMLRHYGFDVTVLDIDPALGPRVGGDVRCLPFADGSFDAVVCCQVLEHVPYGFFEKALAELRRVARLGAVVSLPDRTRCSRLLPMLLRRRKVMDWPIMATRECSLMPGHHWEIGIPRYPLGRIVSAIKRNGWCVKAMYRPWEIPYQRFWRLAKEA